MTISIIKPMIDEFHADSNNSRVMEERRRMGENILNTSIGVGVASSTGSVPAGEAARTVASEVTGSAPDSLKDFAFAVGNGLTFGLLGHLAKAKANS